MPLTDKQKLDLAITKLTEKINAQREGTWSEFKTWLSKVTKAKIKTLINNAITEQQTINTAQSDELDDWNTGSEEIKNEINGL